MDLVISLDSFKIEIVRNIVVAPTVEILRVEVVLLIGGHWPPIKLIDLIKMQIS